MKMGSNIILNDDENFLLELKEKEEPVKQK